MFTGYTDQTVDVFWGIRFNNDRAWFAEHKQEFQDAVMAPTKALAAELYDWFRADYPDLHLNLHISRIYRDARRLFGRGPLNDHIWFSFQNAIENAVCWTMTPPAARSFCETSTRRTRSRSPAPPMPGPRATRQSRSGGCITCARSRWRACTRLTRAATARR